MAADAHLVVLSDHPSLHRGFATVARAVAAHLHAHVAPDLDYVGYYAPDPAWASPGYAVHAVESDGDRRADRIRRVRECLARIAAEHAPRRLVLLAIGTDFDLGAVARAVDELALEPRPTLVGHAPIDYAPVAVTVADLLAPWDVFVPYSAFSREAVLDALRRAGSEHPCIADPIPHGVDTSVFRPLAPQARRRARREHLGVGDDEVLLAFFGRNSGQKRTDVIVRLVHAVLTGEYARCARCSVAAACSLRGDGTAAVPPARCSLCDHDVLRPGRPRDAVRVYLHTDRHSAETAAATRGRDVHAIAARLGIRERIAFRDDLRIGRGDTQRVLAERMASCDVHLAPYDCGGWELTVLETGACGVPNVITETATPAEYAAPWSRVVPVGTHVVHDGARGLIDADLALTALLDLVDRPGERARLAAAGSAAAARYDWSRVGAAWADLVAPLLRGPGAGTTS